MLGLKPTPRIRQLDSLLLVPADIASASGGALICVLAGMGMPPRVPERGAFACRLLTQGPRVRAPDRPRIQEGERARHRPPRFEGTTPGALESEFSQNHLGSAAACLA